MLTVLRPRPTQALPYQCFVDALPLLRVNVEQPASIGIGGSVAGLNSHRGPGQIAEPVGRLGVACFISLRRIHSVQATSPLGTSEGISVDYSCDPDAPAIFAA